jgi:hydrogenase-4 component B
VIEVLALPLFVVMVLGYAAGAAGALTGPTPRGARGVAAAGAIVGSGAGLVLGLDAVIRGTAFQLEIPQLLAVAGGISLRLDRLGAFFLLIVDAIALPAVLFGATYSRIYEGHYSLRLLGAMLNLFLLTMSLVPFADNVVTFLLFWEGMSVTSYFLVMTESDRRETRRAGLWYLAMTHGGLVLLMTAFLLLGATAPSTGFGDLRSAAGALPPAVRNAVFVLALLGFGSKAGVVPLHVWLPLAHPAAPSHVSALLSGVMIKMGVYGVVRVALDLLGGGPPWWGGVVLAVGAVSALLGVLYALMEHDLKRLLAYHSVENVGIIFLGLGAGLMFQSYGMESLALVGLVAGLYHTLNHACFKGLLFLGAGAVLHATHTRNMEELGGLIKGMPRTALCFLVGAAAISGLPPLNGFVSEWLVFQALLGGSQLPRPELALIMALAVAMLALTSGLAAACFVKAFGITFLAMPRSDHAARAREVPPTMWLGTTALALACVGLGVGPTLVVPVLGGVMAGLGGLPEGLVPAMPGLTLTVPGTVGAIAPAALAVGLALVPLAVVAAFRLGAADRRVRTGDTWGCGRIGQTSRMEYTATAFAEPLRRVFAELYRPTEDLSIDFHPESRYFVQSIAYRSEVHPWIERLLYAPAVSLLRRTAFGVRRLQAGSLHLYLLYMVLALVALLVMSRWTG